MRGFAEGVPEAVLNISRCESDRATLRHDQGRQLGSLREETDPEMENAT